jgi:hypothetical protein
MASTPTKKEILLDPAKMVFLTLNMFGHDILHDLYVKSNKNRTIDVARTSPGSDSVSPNPSGGSIIQKGGTTEIDKSMIEDMFLLLPKIIYEFSCVNDVEDSASAASAPGVVMPVDDDVEDSASAASAPGVVMQVDDDIGDSVATASAPGVVMQVDDDIGDSAATASAPGVVMQVDDDIGDSAATASATGVIMPFHTKKSTYYVPGITMSRLDNMEDSASAASAPESASITLKKRRGIKLPNQKSSKILKRGGYSKLIYNMTGGSIDLSKYNICIPNETPQFFYGTIDSNRNDYNDIIFLLIDVNRFFSKDVPEYLKPGNIYFNDLILKNSDAIISEGSLESRTYYNITYSSIREYKNINIRIWNKKEIVVYFEKGDVGGTIEKMYSLVPLKKKSYNMVFNGFLITHDIFEKINDRIYTDKFDDVDKVYQLIQNITDNEYKYNEIDTSLNLIKHDIDASFESKQTSLLNGYLFVMKLIQHVDVFTNYYLSDNFISFSDNYARYISFIRNRSDEPAALFDDSIEPFNSRDFYNVDRYLEYIQSKYDITRVLFMKNSKYYTNETNIDSVFYEEYAKLILNIQTDNNFYTILKQRLNQYNISGTTRDSSKDDNPYLYQMYLLIDEYIEDETEVSEIDEDEDSLGVDENENNTFVKSNCLFDRFNNNENNISVQVKYALHLIDTVSETETLTSFAESITPELIEYVKSIHGFPNIFPDEESYVNLTRYYFNGIIIDELNEYILKSGTDYIKNFLQNIQAVGKEITPVDPGFITFTNFLNSFLVSLVTSPYVSEKLICMKIDSIISSESAAVRTGGKKQKKTRVVPKKIKHNYFYSTKFITSLLENAKRILSRTARMREATAKSNVYDILNGLIKIDSDIPNNYKFKMLSSSKKDFTFSVSNFLDNGLLDEQDYATTTTQNIQSLVKSILTINPNDDEPITLLNIVDNLDELFGGVNSETDLTSFGETLLERLNSVNSGEVLSILKPISYNSADVKKQGIMEEVKNVEMFINGVTYLLYQIILATHFPHYLLALEAKQTHYDKEFVINDEIQTFTINGVTDTYQTSLTDSQISKVRELINTFKKKILLLQELKTYVESLLNVGFTLNAAQRLCFGYTVSFAAISAKTTIDSLISSDPAILNNIFVSMQRKILDKFTPNYIEGDATNSKTITTGGASLDDKLMKQFVKILLSYKAGNFQGSAKYLDRFSPNAKENHQDTFFEDLQTDEAGVKGTYIVEQIRSLINENKYYINNAATAKKNKQVFLDVQGTHFCPVSSITDNQSTCSNVETAAQRDGLDFNPMYVVIRNATETPPNIATETQPNIAMYIHLVATNFKKDIPTKANLSFCLIVGDDTIINFYTPGEAPGDWPQTESLSFIDDKDVQSAIEIDITGSSITPMDAKECYKRLLNLITGNGDNSIRRLWRDAPAIITWRTFYDKLSHETDPVSKALRSRILSISFQKLMGDFLQELNGVVNTDFNRTLTKSNKLIVDTNQLRLFIGNDRPSSIRAILLTLYGTGDINPNSISGFMNQQGYYFLALRNGTGSRLSGGRKKTRKRTYKKTRKIERKNKKKYSKRQNNTKKYNKNNKHNKKTVKNKNR